MVAATVPWELRGSYGFRLSITFTPHTILNTRKTIVFLNMPQRVLSSKKPIDLCVCLSAVLGMVAATRSRKMSL